MFVLSRQSPNGVWGQVRAYDGQRSAYLAHYLDWYHRAIDPDPRAPSAAAKFIDYVLDAENTAHYGVCNIVHIPGFVGLVLANVLSSDLDICLCPGPAPLGTFDLARLRALAGRWDGAEAYTSSDDERSIE